MTDDINGKPAVPDFMQALIERRAKAQQNPTLDLFGPFPEGLCPRPLPVWVTTVVAVMDDGVHKVATQTTTPGGVNFHYVDPETAIKIGEGYLRAGKFALEAEAKRKAEAESKIEVVPANASVKPEGE